MANSLAACISKVDWAKEHRDRLADHIRKLFAVESNYPSVRMEFDAHASAYVFKVSHLPTTLAPARERASLMIGDIVHGLRGALDYLAVRIFLHDSPGNRIGSEAAQKIQFPIIRKAQDWPSVPNNVLQGVSGQHAGMIERFQPYNRLGLDEPIDTYVHPLEILNVISNADKHRCPPLVMIDVMGVQPTAAGKPVFEAIHRQVRSALAAGGGAGVNGFLLSGKPIELGTEVSRITIPGAAPQPDVDMAGYVIPQIAFDDSKRNVVPVIDRIAEYVLQIIRDFEPRI